MLVLLKVIPKIFFYHVFKKYDEFLGREMQKRSKLRKGRLRGFVLKMLRLGWLAGWHTFWNFLKKNEVYHNLSPNRTNVGMKGQV